MRDATLIIFAKQPVPGRVKTRLQPVYTAAQAAAIASLLVEETIKLAASSWAGPVYLAGAPTADHPLFHDLARRFAVGLLAQSEGDLGQRMQEALCEGIERHGAAAVMGSDVPHCPPSVLHEAQLRLKRGQSVLGPTEDGGYYLMGLDRSDPALFRDIAWGGTDVREVTLARARVLGMEFTLLPPLRDVDTPDDLAAAADHCAPLRALLESYG